jgi:hypothetical protein
VDSGIPVNSLFVVHFLCLSLCPVFKGAKKMNQQCFVRRKKRQLLTWSAYGELPCAAQNNRALRKSSAFSGLRQSSRLSGNFSTARLREMALTKEI